MISIALCTYNGEKYLHQQLDSIAGQTRLPCELVVSDDCSSDRTVEILETFAREAPFPVHIHQNEENLGSTRNFENAIKSCSGDIIALCDQDDVWLPEKLEKLEIAFKDHPDIGYAFSNGELVDDALQPLGRTVWQSNQFEDEMFDRYAAGEQLLCFLRWQFVTGATMAFRARLKKYIFPFPEHKIWIHDGWIAVVGSSIGEIGLPINESLILYRQHSLQQIGADLSDRQKGFWYNLKMLKENRKDFIQMWSDYSAFFQHLQKHLQNYLRKDIPENVKSIEILNKFEHHFENRLKIWSGKKPEKLMLILGELFSGRYRKFSNSWKSALADMIF